MYISNSDVFCPSIGEDSILSSDDESEEDVVSCEECEQEEVSECESFSSSSD